MRTKLLGMLLIYISLIRCFDQPFKDTYEFYSLKSKSVPCLEGKGMRCELRKGKRKEREFLTFLVYYQILIELNQICKSLSSYYLEELYIGQNYSFSVANYRWYITRNPISQRLKFQINVIDSDCKVRPYFEYLCYDTLFNSTVSARILYNGFTPSENCNTSFCWAQQGQDSEIYLLENVVYYIYRIEGRDFSNNYKSCNFTVSISEY